MLIHLILFNIKLEKNFVKSWPVLPSRIMSFCTWYVFLQIVVFLVMICAFCSIACLFWETSTGKRFQMYLPWSFVIPTDQLSGAIIVSLLVFFSYAIVLNTVVPISLYVRWVLQLKSSLVKYLVENLLKYASLYYF